MANVFTDLEPDLYRALDVVSRELVGAIPAVSSDMNAEQVAKDQVIRSFVAPASTAADTTPGQLPPDTGDQTFTNRTITISKDRHVPIRWTAEDQKSMNTGPGYNPMRVNQFAQAMRTLTNEVEGDLIGLAIDASRAAAQSGSGQLFDSGLKDAGLAEQILDANGAPMSDRHIILNSQAALNMRSLTQLTNVNNAGDESFLRQGVWGDIFGFNIRKSGQEYSHTAGTGTGYLVNSASLAVGDTVIPVDTGTGTIVAGDVLVFAGDPNKYVVDSALSGGNVTIQAPGLLTAVADNSTVTVETADLNRVMAFSRDAIHLVTRAPAMPVEGDSNDGVTFITDPRSGLTFSVALYKEYKRVKYEIGLAWGYAVMNPEHLMVLID